MTSKDYEPLDDDTIVELSIASITRALAEALKVANVKRPAIRIGDRVTISGVVTGPSNNAANLIPDGMESPKYGRAFPVDALVLEERR